MFRAVHDRCSVDFSSLSLPFSQEEAITRLAAKGCRVLKTETIVQIARSCIGVSRYRRGARMAEAPHIFDCSSFVKWLYGQQGIWLPRRTIQQIHCGTTIDLPAVAANDVIFTTGAINYYHQDPAQGVGHAGIATGEGTVIHAANAKAGVVETSLEPFLFPRGTKLRGIRRYIINAACTVVLKTPPSLEVESSDDLYWILLSSLAP